MCAMSPSVSALLPVEDERSFDSRQRDAEVLEERPGTRTPPPSPSPPVLTAPVTVCGNASDGSLGGNSCALFQNSAVNVNCDWKHHLPVVKKKKKRDVESGFAVELSRFSSPHKEERRCRSDLRDIFICTLLRSRF